MPLFTFVCLDEGCAYEEEVLCKSDEIKKQKVLCPSDFHQAEKPYLEWQGVELVQARDDFQKGRFAMKAIMPDGKKLPINNINSPRSKGRGDS